MCTRRALFALLSALIEEEDEQEDAREKLDAILDDGDREKALRTLLDERGPGQRRILPEHRPLGGATLLGGHPTDGP